MDQYEKYEKLVYKLAWRYVRVGFEFDDLFSEANMAYIEALRTYNPDTSKCGFCTHLYNLINWRLCKFTKPSIRPGFDFNPESLSKSNYNQQKFLECHADQLKRVIFKDQIEKSDSDVIIIINLIFDMPDRLYRMCREVTCPKITRRRLLRYLTEEIDWSPKRANLALSTIHNLIRRNE